MSKAERRYTLFMDTILNKVDAKGRVSIPADYRALLEQKNTELTAFPSFKHPCIECFTSELMEKMANDLEKNFNPFSEEEDDFSNSIFAQAKEFAFDSTGRIILTEKLLSHAKITDKALFVGKGKTFQIWNPDLYEIENQKRITRIQHLNFNIKHEE
ncbi:MAG: division/cell wall cluster transcriptional repressor MraZ [Alphaproteobacteria bacterium]|nr:division/cell wall cluster transcriptional repressor MraZ [Alphaproteobacteria bacterium]